MRVQRPEPKIKKHRRKGLPEQLGTALVPRAILDRVLGGQGEARFGRGSVENLAGDVLAKCGPMFEPVARASAGKPYIFHFRGTLHKKIATRRVFVLAHAPLNARRVP